VQQHMCVNGGASRTQLQAQTHDAASTNSEYRRILDRLRNSDSAGENNGQRSIGKHLTCAIKTDGEVDKN